MMMLEFHGIALILIVLYLCITFGFSIFEKVLNWSESIKYYKNHFTGSFVSNRLVFWLVMVVMMELLSLIFSALGLFYHVLSSSSGMVGLGLICSSVTLMVLMIGQRIAKDYQGAANLTVYFILSIFGILLIQF